MIEPPRNPPSRTWSDDDFIAMFESVDNAGRWGDDDELGTLNHITPRTRIAAAKLVTNGIVVPLSHPFRTSKSANITLTGFHTERPDPESGAPPFVGDHVAMEVHQQTVTHVDSVSHIGSHRGLLYNRRPVAETVDDSGIRLGSVAAMREGVITRGVLLDVASASGVRWLEPTTEIRPHHLEAAERHAHLEVTTGDAVVVRTGVAAREREHGSHPLAAGPGPEAALWMNDRRVAVYTGDAPDHISDAGARILGRLPPTAPPAGDGPTSTFPLPFHQIAIPAMGLLLLDHAAVEELAQVCEALGRYEFMFVVAPLTIPGGSGSPVNPLAVF